MNGWGKETLYVHAYMRRRHDKLQLAQMLCEKYEVIEHNDCHSQNKGTSKQCRRQPDTFNYGIVFLRLCRLIYYTFFHTIMIFFQSGSGWNYILLGQTINCFCSHVQKLTVPLLLHHCIQTWQTTLILEDLWQSLWSSFSFKKTQIYHDRLKFWADSLYKTHFF